MLSNSDAKTATKLLLNTAAFSREDSNDVVRDLKQMIVFYLNKTVQAKKVMTKEAKLSFFII